MRARAPGLTALALAAVAFAAPAVAQEQQVEPAAGEDTVKGTEVRLSESAGRELTEDRLQARLRVELRDTEPGRLQELVNARMAQALERTRSVPSAQVSTGGYYVVHMPKEDLWVGRQEILLDSGAPQELLALVGELQSLDGFVMSGLHYYLSRDAAEAVGDELTVLALARVRERLRVIADALGLATVRLRELQVGDGGGMPPPRPLARAMMETAEAAPPPSAAPGETRVEVRVEALAELFE